MKKTENADITHEEDLSFAIMNLIGIEEHLAMTSVKAKKVEYLHVLSAVRKLRINMLKQLVKNPEGEVWCISKHLLSSTMRMMEVATKHLESDVKTAHEYEKHAFDLYGLFWLLQKMQPSEQPETSEHKTKIAAQAAEAKT